MHKVPTATITPEHAADIADRALVLRIEAIHRFLPPGKVLRIGLFVRRSPPFELGTTLALDWSARFADKEATPETWRDVLLPALERISKAIRQHAPGRAVEAFGLTHTLRAIHPFALCVLLKELKQEGVDGIFRDIDSLQTQAAAMNETIARVTAMRPPEQEAAEVLFSASELLMAQMELVQDYNTPPPPEAKGLIFITRDFPASYVQALDELIHPPCFAACFVANPADASMWGSYGDAHTGLCLKFKTTADSEGRPALNLDGITGWRGGKGMEMEPVHSFHLRTFYKVNYSDSYPEIDFFNSIGLLPVPLLNAVWYTDDDGQRSTSRGARYLDTEAWRQKYWEAFQSGAICKISEWEHEKEYRILLWSSLNDLKDKPSRKLRYKFSDLSGIVFGANTAHDDKLKIMKIVEEKCRAEKRNEFEFYQAQYCRKDRSFRIAPLSLIRFE